MGIMGFSKAIAIKAENEYKHWTNYIINNAHNLFDFDNIQNPDDSWSSLTKRFLVIS